jgi:hypothetical protein
MVRFLIPIFVRMATFLLYIMHSFYSSILYTNGGNLGHTCFFSVAVNDIKKMLSQNLILITLSNISL